MFVVIYLLGIIFNFISTTIFFSVFIFIIYDLLLKMPQNFGCYNFCIEEYILIGLIITLIINIKRFLKTNI